jgi:predicted metal-dependent peptidase
MIRHQKFSELIESLPLDLSSEEYFSILMNDPNVQEMIKSGKDEENLSSESMDTHEGWDEMSEEEREYVSGKVREIVKAAQERADSDNRWGSVPNHMKEEIRKKVRGEINWKSVLRQFVGCTQRADRMSSVYRLNKKYPGVHSGSSRDYKPTINIYLDQSGSVTDDWIALFFGELANLAHRVEFKLFYFDTEVDEENAFVWRRGAFPKQLRTRCGGTDFEAPTRHAHQSKCEGYLILTDGGADKPSSSRIRRAWVIVPGQELAFNNPDQKDVIIKMKKQII